MTQVELAEASGVSRRTIQSIEAEDNTPTTGTVVKILRTLTACSSECAKSRT